MGSGVSRVRAVFDTTILASLSVATQDPLAYLRRAAEQRLFELCASDFILDELGRTQPTKPKFHLRSWLDGVRVDPCLHIVAVAQNQGVPARRGRRPHAQDYSRGRFGRRVWAWGQAGGLKSRG